MRSNLRFVAAALIEHAGRAVPGAAVVHRPDRLALQCNFLFGRGTRRTESRGAGAHTCLHVERIRRADMSHLAIGTIDERHISKAAFAPVGATVVVTHAAPLIHASWRR